MAKKKNSILPKFEVLIILVFFVSFMAWAAKKCSETKAMYQDETMEEEDTSTETASAEISDSTAMTLTNLANNNNTTATPPAQTSPPPAPTSTPAQPRYTPLYVTIDGLKMRTAPTRDSSVILKLKLFEQVNYMGEFTDSTEQINLGYEIADEPWFKVQHRRGKVGWVYGAGINFYKKKRSGVVE